MSRVIAQDELKAVVLPGLPGVRLPSPGLPQLPVPGPAPARDYIRPLYAGQFRCIASACEDTCCQGWSVPIDQATYEKYRTIDLLKPHLGTLIVLNTSGQTTSDYARIPLTTEKTCAFLDEARLCGIQKQLGPEALSGTCATYPRAVKTVAGAREEALNLSCPEAARLALLDDDLLGLGHPSPGARYAAIQYAGHGPDAGDGRLAIREFALLLVGDRSYDLWQRAYLLGILARRLRMSGDDGRLMPLLADSARVAAQGRMRGAMDDVAHRPAEQLQLTMEMLRIRLSQPPISSRFMECVQDFEAGLGCATATSERQILDAYDENYRRFYRPLMSRYPQLLENYALNYVFKSGYPFGRGTGAHPEDPEGETMLLCVHLALVQTLLIGMAGRYREEFAVEHVVKLVQTLARTFEHSREAQDQMREFVRAKGLRNLRGIGLLLKLG